MSASSWPVLLLLLAALAEDQSLSYLVHRLAAADAG
jgi:hypothetical protein